MKRFDLNFDGAGPSSKTGSAGSSPPLRSEQTPADQPGLTQNSAAVPGVFDQVVADSSATGALDGYPLSAGHSQTDSHPLSTGHFGGPVVPTDVRFYAPIHYVESYAYPLLVYLHGRGNNAGEMGQIIRHISPRNYVAVGVGGNQSLDGRGTQFDWNRSTAATHRSTDAVFDAIDAATERFNVHDRRVVLVGRDTGGSMALKIAAAHPKRFAGVVSIGGRMPRLNLPSFQTNRRQKLPMLWQWAEKNPQYGMDSIEADCRVAMTIGSKVHINQYPGDDELDTVLLGDIDRWIMSTVAGKTAIVDPRRTIPAACGLN